MKDYPPEDEAEWMRLAKQLGIWLPQKKTKLTNRLHVEIHAQSGRYSGRFYDWAGTGITPRKFIALNPRLPAREFAGIFLETWNRRPES